jgi:hypothetical protein
VVPVIASRIQIIHIYPLVYRCFVRHPRHLGPAYPGDAMPDHHVFEVIIEKMNLIVMHQQATLVESIEIAHRDF